MAAALEGELTFATVSRKLDEARETIGADGEATIDLSGVTRVDSAGLALLLELTRQGKAGGREVRFVGAPQRVRELAGFFGLGGVLRLE